MSLGYRAAEEKDEHGRVQSLVESGVRGLMYLGGGGQATMRAPCSLLYPQYLEEFLLQINICGMKK